MFIELDRNCSVPMIRQRYMTIRDRIHAGELSGGNKMPSTRNLAKNLQVSRVVVLEAYEQLLAEGYLEARKGSGTYVSTLPLGEDVLKLHSMQEKDVENPMMSLRSEPQEGVIDMRTGAPDLSLFPLKRWGAIYKDICHDLNPTKLDYYKSMGSWELRTQIADYLYRSRGIGVKPSQIFITTGAAQSFTLIGRMMKQRTKVISVPVDDEGIMVDRIDLSEEPGLVFTTPSHQCTSYTGQ